MSAFLMTVANVLAGFEFVLSAAVRALGNAGAGHIQVDLGVAVPKLHVGFVAGAKHAAVAVQIFCQEFNWVAHFVIPKSSDRGSDFCYSDFGEPVCVLGVATVDDVKERSLNFFSDRAAAALAQLDAVEFADGRDFSGGACEERFVSDVHLVARDALLHNL